MNRKSKLGIGYFLHPIPIVAVFSLFINDHFLKAAWPGLITGKLSDFAGVFFLPLYLCALAGLFANYVLRNRVFWITTQQIVLAILITDFIFVSVKLWPLANAFYLEAMNKIGVPSRLTMDPWDLSALTMNVATYMYAQSFIKVHEE